MKYHYFILFFIIFNVREVQGEEVLFKYNKEYMEYSYDNATVILGDIKKSSDLKKISSNKTLEKFPYDGIEITIMKDKKLYYMITENEKTPLPKMEIINYMNQDKKSFFVEDYLILNMGESNLNSEKKYKLNQEDLPITRKLIYGERVLRDNEYKDLYLKLKELNIKLNKYYKNQVIPSRRVEITELVSKLGYVTEVSVLENKVIYWEEEEKMLQNNEIYLQLKEMEVEIFKYIQKF